MVYGTHLSTAGMMVNQHRQNVIANNLANIDTPGFKHDIALFTERPVESREDADAGRWSHVMYDNLSGGVLASATRHVLTQGPITTTGRRLDVTIEGPGYFAIETDRGVRYTRDGRMAVAGDGTLRTAVGQLTVLSEGGQPIVVGPGAEINGDGRVMEDGAVVARLQVVDFDDPTVLRKEGGNRYVATTSDRPRSLRPQLVPGALEGSTVDPVNGLAQMIDATRAFEMNANFLRMQDQTLGRTVNDVARF